VNRAEKVDVAAKLNESFGQTPHIILATFRGLSVNQSTELRRKVRAAGGGYRVIKNRIAKRAAEGTAMEKLTDRLTGPCAVASHESDPVSLAKTLHDFAKDNPQLELLAGVVDAKDVLDSQGVEALSKLPGLQELRAQLLSVVQMPATTLVRLIQTPGSQLARVLDARKESMEGGDQG
jgi:large subunit ribosomal protein L10